jgi:enamine deaminase RidA (YjgF/YER057c/UK114 family)
MTLPTSQNGVRILTPAGAITPTGPWSLGTRAGDFLFVAGMRGIDPASNRLLDGDETRIRQGFLNMQTIAASEGASLRDAVRIVVYVTDMTLLRPLVNKVQEELLILTESIRNQQRRMEEQLLIVKRVGTTTVELHIRFRI